MPFVSSVRGSYGPQDKKSRPTPEADLVGIQKKFNEFYSKLAAGGNTITTAGGYRIHTFTSTGQTFDTSSLPTTSVEYLVIAGGGGGHRCHGGGGGGAGGYQTGTSPTPSGSYPVAVGSSPDYRDAGQPSSVRSITSTGGGRGGSAHPTDPYGSQPGGSGGGYGYHSGGGGGGAGSGGGNSAGPINYGQPANGTAGQGNGGGLGAYAAWNPYAEFYMITTGFYNEIETYQGPGVQIKIQKRMKSLGIPFSINKIFVEDDISIFY